MYPRLKGKKGLYARLLRTRQTQFFFLRAEKRRGDRARISRTYEEWKEGKKKEDSIVTKTNTRRRGSANFAGEGRGKSPRFPGRKKKVPSNAGKKPPAEEENSFPLSPSKEKYMCRSPGRGGKKKSATGPVSGGEWSSAKWEKEGGVAMKGKASFLKQAKKRLKSLGEI